jgi:AAA+ ATPase superfamily predicted ATPase
LVLFYLLLLDMNLETRRLRGRPRNRWQDEMREDRRLAGGKVWKKTVYNRVEWEKLLRTARNHHILHTPME